MSDTKMPTNTGYKKEKKTHIFTILERKDIEIKNLTDKVTALTLHINLIESFILEKRAERLNDGNN